MTPSIRLSLPALLAGGLSLTACATHRPPTIALDASVATPAIPEPSVPKPVDVVAVPEPLPLPGQLKALEPASESLASEAHAPTARVETANVAARIQPSVAGYVNAVQVYPYAEGALYQVYAAPGDVTDIALEAGEQLAGTGPVAAGDTVRWIIGDTESGSGLARRVHILLKPTRALLTTNLVINTDRRTYHLELHALAHTYMASVSWAYPADQLIALKGRQREAEIAAPVDLGVDVAKLAFRYRIEGDRPPWRPTTAFDDGQKVYIQMPANLAQGEAPPLFVIGQDGKGELVNYRVRQNYYIVDRLFAAAELRLGDKHQSVVRIVRADGRRGPS